MAVLANASKEKVNAAYSLDGVLIGDALGLEVGRIAIEDVHVGWVDVDVREEVLPHERVVRLRVVAGDADVLIHVESDDIFKGDLIKQGRLSVCCDFERKSKGQKEKKTYLASLVLLDKHLVNTQRTGASGQTQDEGVVSGWVESLDAVDDVVCHIGAGSSVVVADDQSHLG